MGFFVTKHFGVGCNRNGVGFNRNGVGCNKMGLVVMHVTFSMVHAKVKYIKIIIEFSWNFA